jgi:hypothetical protein
MLTQHTKYQGVWSTSLDNDTFSGQYGPEIVFNEPGHSPSPPINLKIESPSETWIFPHSNKFRNHRFS